MKGSFFRRLRLMLPVFLLLIAVSITPRVQAQRFVESFEAFQHDALDANGTGANAGTNGGANPWFGPFPPNFQVVGAETGVTPHGGTNMVGAANSYDLDYYNLAYRLNGGNAYLGNLMLDWWFYDPAGRGAGATNFQDSAALAGYSNIPGDADYDGDPNGVPGTALQLFSLGGTTDNSAGMAATNYQALILGADGGYDPGSGWFNTATPRTVGWHHARIIVSPVITNTTVLASCYIDDMTNATLTQSTALNGGFNSIELKGGFGSVSGYFDDISFGSGPPPTLQISQADTNVIVTWPPGWVLQSSPDLSGPNFGDVQNATSPYTNAVSGAQLFFRLRD